MYWINIDSTCSRINKQGYPEFCLNIIVIRYGGVSLMDKHFDIPFLANLALREKQIQQNYRPVIAVHKWFARRPGTLFRGLLLSEFGDGELQDLFYQSNTSNRYQRPELGPLQHRMVAIEYYCPHCKPSHNLGARHQLINLLTIWPTGLFAV